MKKYETPELEVTEITQLDIITTSLGATGPTIEEEYNPWKIDVEI